MGGGDRRRHTPSPVGPFTISSKDKNPTWHVPDSIYRRWIRRAAASCRRARQPDGRVPDPHVEGDYHPRHRHAVGDRRETTHGIRLYPEDIGELYSLVKPSMRGELVYEPVKVGERRSRLHRATTTCTTTSAAWRAKPSASFVRPVSPTASIPPWS
jgi:hypothetical protein